MKKYRILLLLTLVFFGCEKYEDYRFDFDYTTVYFPFQRPVRTVIMGEGLEFEVGVVFGGKRDNQQKETVQYELEPQLLDGTGFTLLPENYYDLSNDSEMIIEPGSIHGRVTVSLDSTAFLNDPASHLNTYAIPLRITSTTADSVLLGLVNEESGNYEVAPKDYTIVVIKYINPYHGTYYHKGVEYVFDPDNNPVDTLIFSNKDLVKNFTWDLSTTAPFQVNTTGIGSSRFDDPVGMKLTINGNNVNIELAENAPGDYISLTNNTSVYNEAEREFYLDYEFTDDANNIHHVMDTLVFRNNGMQFETW